MRSYGSRVAPYSNMTGLLIKERSLETDRHTGRMPCENKGKDWGSKDVAAHKKHQRLPVNHQKLGERHETDSPSQLSQCCRHLDLGTVSLEDIHFLCLRHPVCATFLWQSQETKTWTNNPGQVKAIFWPGLSHGQAHHTRNGMTALE